MHEYPVFTGFIRCGSGVCPVCTRYGYENPLCLQGFHSYYGVYPARMAWRYPRSWLGALRQ